MKKILLLSTLIFLFTSCKKEPDTPITTPSSGNNNVINLNNCGGKGTTDLLAGQHTKVGVVEVESFGNYISVTYRITEDGYAISEVHLDVEEAWQDMPINRGQNPKIGHYEFTEDFLPFVLTYTVDSIDVSGFSSVIISAHSVIENVPNWISPNNINVLNIIDFDEVDMIGSSRFTTSYIKAELESNSGQKGTFDAWCLEKGTPLNNQLPTKIVLRDPRALTGAEVQCMQIKQPPNLDLITYLVNQTYPSAGVSEFQGAIWTLVGNSNPSNFAPQNSWDQSIVNSMVVDAQQNGNGYEPGPCDVQVIVTDARKCTTVGTPQVQIQYQTTLLTYQPCVPSSGNETAWGSGTSFPGGNWAMYFEYCK